MNLLRKAHIFFNLQLYSHSKEVDALLWWLMHNTEIDHNKSDRWNVALRGPDGKIYKVWAANYPYGDLSECRTTWGDFLWRNERPSRKVKIEFWEWIEQQLGGMTYEDFIIRKITDCFTRLRQNSKDNHYEDD